MRLFPLLFLGFLACGISTGAIAQSSTDQTFSTATEAKPGPVEVSGVVDELELVREYFSFDVLPEDFPRYENGSLEGYQAQVRRYAKAHPELLKPEYKAKLEARSSTPDK